MGFNEASLMLKISLVMVGLGMLFHLIGFASEYWTSYDVGFYTSHYGLWSFGSGKKASKYRSTCFCVFFVFYLFILFTIYSCMNACVHACVCVRACVHACMRACFCVFACACARARSRACARARARVRVRVLGCGICVPT